MLKKIFFPSVSKHLQSLPRLLSVCLCGAGAPTPAAQSGGSVWDGAEAARPSSELQDPEPAEECLAVTAQHSAVQHPYPPNAFHTQQIELLWSSHLFFFQQTKQLFPSFSLTKTFAICSKSIATFLMLCYRPHLGLCSKKWQLKHFCFCFNQTKIETFCSLIQGLMCLITPLLLCIWATS